MLKHITFENIAYVSKVVFWAMFYASTAASMLAALYASVEGVILGSAIKYNGRSRTIGLGLLFGGLVMVLASSGLAAVMTGLGDGIGPMLTKLSAAQTGGDTLGLAALVVSCIVFDCGVWLYLTSEEPRPLKH